jgi:ribosomal protein S14
MSNRVEYEPVEPDPQTFVQRQTANLQRLVETVKQLGRFPKAVLTEHERQELCVEQGSVRCPRCGSVTGAFFPQPCLCEVCFRDVLARDQGDFPGCVWWHELTHRLDRRSMESNPNLKPE